MGGGGGEVVERNYVVQNGRVLEYDYFYVGIICWSSGDYNFDGWFGFIFIGIITNLVISLTK